MGLEFVKTERRGRKPKYKSPGEMQAEIDKYFDYCQLKEIFPDLAGMRIWLKISAATLKNYCDESHEDYEDYRAILEEAKDRRESFLVRLMTSDNKRAQGCMNALKQKDNGGYVDKPVDSGVQTLTINVNGIPGGMNAFK